jgi:hypothetical protein
MHGPGVHDLGNYTSPSGEDFTSYRVTFASDRTFSFWFTITNDGPLGVTITRIGAVPDRFDQLPVESVRFQPADQAKETTSTPFHPMSLGSHQAINVLVTIRMRGCMEGHSSTVLGQVPVTYRALSFTKHRWLPLPESIEVGGAPGTTCPSGST